MAVLCRTLRAYFDISQGELAVKSGVSRPTIARLETLKGIESFKVETLEKLLEYFENQGVRFSIEHDEIVLHLPKRAIRLR